MVSKSVVAVSLLVLMVVVVSGCVEQPIGGQTDEHGCLIAAGYSWNESLGFCLREWELNENQREAARMAVAPLSYYVTVTGVDVTGYPESFTVLLQRNDNRQTFQVTLKDLENNSGSNMLNRECDVDEDCVVFGESGDCNCGCYNKDSQWEAGGACFCAAPASCKCVNHRCEGVF